MKIIKKIFIYFILIFLSFGKLSIVEAYESLQGPTELLFWDKGETYDGYTLFAAGGDTYLIDMAGNMVHSWEGTGRNPRLLDNGNLLDSGKDKNEKFNLFFELNWDNKIVWEYAEEREGYTAHHDWVRIFNKKLNAYTTLYIANKDLSLSECIEAGCIWNDKYEEPLQMDAIVEIDMDGNVVWEWWFFDHVIQDFNPQKKNYVGAGKEIADYPEKLNLNLPGRLVKRDWLHSNSIDYNEDLDQVVINSVHGEFYVIDHGNTFVPGDPKQSILLASSDWGDFLYRFGDPARYGQGKSPIIRDFWIYSSSEHKQIGGSHDIQWIDKGLPGEENFLVFNNGQYLFERTNQSYIMEINPFLDIHGNNLGKYINPSYAGYKKIDAHKSTHKPWKFISNQVVWTYGSKSNQGFFSHIGSGAQRLPNGNTLICSATEGHLFEITLDGNLVWEYINPVSKDGNILKVMPDNLPMTNSVFRAYRYNKDHPALKGKDLDSFRKITDNLIGTKRHFFTRNKFIKSAIIIFLIFSVTLFFVLKFKRKRKL